MFSKILLTAVITAASAIALPVQVRADATTQPTTQEGRRHPLEHVRDAVEKLNLTADQKTQVEKIMEDARAQLKPLLESVKGGDREKIRDQVRDIVKDTIQKISAILTEEQKHHLKEIIQAHREAAGDAKK